MTDPGARAATSDGRALLSLRHVSKEFGGQRVLDCVDLDLEGGRVHGLVGHNGSGKSTLIKVLAGYHTPEPGASARVAGESLQLGSATSVEQAGIRFVHQDLGLVSELSTVDNLALGRGYESGRWIRVRAEAEFAQQVLSGLGQNFDVEAPLSALAPVERSMVAIARALHPRGGRSLQVLVLDEPTESLSRHEAERLFAAIRSVAAAGAAVLYVSHRLTDVLAIADQITVLREGRVVAQRPVSGLDHDELVTLIVGRRLDDAVSTGRSRPGDAVLHVDRLAGLTTDEISFELKAGEVVGVAGIQGSGREEIADLLAGAVARRAGRIELSSGNAKKLVSPYGPRQALTAGIALVARDRDVHSAIPSLAVRENLTLPRLDTRQRVWLDVRRERLTAHRWLTRLGVRPPEPERVLATLSGGNQQKVVLAKALRCRPIVLVLDEPVQGVDVEAKAAIFDQILAAANDGQAVVVASSEAEDLVSICDRVLVMRSGRVRQELTKEMLSVSRIVQECIAADEQRVAA